MFEIKVTVRTIKIRAFYETIKSIKILLPNWIMDLRLIYYKYTNAMMEALINNPDFEMVI